jgi:hypothetical protein
VTVTNPGTSAASDLVDRVTGPFTQTNTCGGSIAAGGSCTVSVKFAPTSGGGHRHPDRGQQRPGSPLTVSLSGTGVTSTTNLALNQPITASSTASGFPATNANDGNTSTYWESTDGAAYPQTLTVNLGSVQSSGRSPWTCRRPPPGHPDRDALGARQHERVLVQPDRGLGRVHVQPVHR